MTIRHIKNTLLLCSTALITLLLNSCASDNKYYTINNDTFWYTTDAKPINSQGGGIFKFYDPQTHQERYFWYGVHYKEADLYRNNPTMRHPKCSFLGVTTYISDNLTEWQSADYALTYEDLNNSGINANGWLGRMGVTYVNEKQTYAMFIQHDTLLMICTSKSPRGPFEYYRHIDMTPYCGTSHAGDQTVFVDPDTNIGYLIYSKARGRNQGFISQIGVDNTDSIGLINCHRVFAGEGREGNCMFKYDNHYYLCASDLWGWDCSHAYFLKSKGIFGPYLPTNDMQKFIGVERDFAHQTQTGFFYTLRNNDNSETVLYCGDRWSDFANNGAGYNQWVPISFTDDNTPIFNSLSSWDFCPQTGKWRIGKKNNYILNGNFEADRRIIPEPVKPRQAFITGWDTEFIEGNIVAHEDSLSPQLNHRNSTDEQNNGAQYKMSLNIADKYSDYRRRISQRIVSTPTVTIPKGKYIFTARICTNDTTVNTTMFASSSIELPEGFFVSSLDVDNGIIKNNLKEDISYDISNLSFRPTKEWKEYSIEIVSDGKPFRVGFDIKGPKGSWCRIDAVSLILTE